MYQPYPTSGAPDPEPVRPEPPTPIQNAVKLMYAGAVISAISLIITLVTIGIVLFALLFERWGMLPALVVLVLVSSLGGDEFKLIEVIGNIVVLAILCTIVFKVGLGMNISVVQGVW